MVPNVYGLRLEDDLATIEPGSCASTGGVPVGAVEVNEHITLCCANQ